MSNFDNLKLRFKDLQRDPKNLEEAYEKFPEFRQIIKEINERVKEKYSLYADELKIDINEKYKKYLEYIIAHYRHQGFRVDASTYNCSDYYSEKILYDLKTTIYIKLGDNFTNNCQQFQNWLSQQLEIDDLPELE